MIRLSENHTLFAGGYTENDVLVSATQIFHWDTSNGLRGSVRTTYAFYLASNDDAFIGTKLAAKRKFERGKKASFV